MKEFRDNSNQISVLIPDGDEGFEAGKVLRCLSQDPRFAVHVLSNKRSSSIRYSRYCKQLHRHSSKNDDQWLDAIESLLEHWKIDIVLPVSLKGVQFVSQRRDVISRYSVIPPMPQYEKIELAHNKWRLHQFAMQNNLPTVPSVFVGVGGESISDSADFESIEYPALLKPILQRGGIGIVKVDNPCDLEKAWKNKLIIKGSEYILQSYISGTDVSFSVFCQSGEIKAYTLWKELLPDKNPFSVPRLVEYTEDEHVVNIGRRLVSAIQWDGVADIDLIIDKHDKTVKILEINPRFWRSLLGSLVAGINFPLMACLTAIGKECAEMKQTRTIKYARPSTIVQMLLYRMLGREIAKGYRLRDSAIRFILSDPLPEFADAFNKFKKTISMRRKM